MPSLNFLIPSRSYPIPRYVKSIMTPSICKRILLLITLIINTACLVNTWHLMHHPSIQPISFILTQSILTHLIGLVLLGLCYRLYSIKPQASMALIYRLGQGLMCLSGLSVAAFTAGGFVRPLSTLLIHQLHLPTAPSILITAAVFILASCAWYHLYTHGNHGMLAWWRQQFDTQPHNQFDRTRNKHRTLLEPHPDQSTFVIHFRIEDKQTTLTAKKRSIGTAETSHFSLLDSMNLMWVAKESALNNDRHPKLYYDQGGNIVLQQPAVKLSKTLQENRTITLTPPQDESLDPVIIHLLKKHLIKYSEQCRETPIINRMTRFTQHIGWLNALSTNAIANMFGLLGIALTFPMLKLNYLPLFLKYALITWAFTVGFFSAIALSGYTLRYMIKHSTRALFRYVKGEGRFPIHYKNIGMLTLCSLMGLIVGLFNYQAAALLCQQLVAYQILSASRIAQLSFYSHILGSIAFIFTAFAVSTLCFKSLSSASKTHLPIAPESTNTQLNSLTIDHIKNLFKPQKTRHVATLLCSGTTAWVFLDATASPSGLIASLLGPQTATLSGDLAFLISFYFMCILFDRGFRPFGSAVSNSSKSSKTEVISTDQNPPLPPQTIHLFPVDRSHEKTHSTPSP